MMYACIDFDGTMVDHVYPEIGKPVPGAIEWCKSFMSSGCKIILWTMRSGKELAEAVNYMTENGIELFGVNENPSQHTWTKSPKAYGHIYIDDAAVGCPLISIKGYNRPCVDWEKISNITGIE
ncbi:MAG: hypothetical protein KAS32_22000 [Candidatus Peribacteraceae bacterium]|nr:hypothetical protein [Candidatus Peribacteraceae bacterium]